jgi:hypothetical protein
MTFDGINTDKTAVKIGDADAQVITPDELSAFFANIMGGRGGGAPGGGAPGGGGPRAGGAAPQGAAPGGRAGPGGPGGGGGGFDPSAMFGQWDADGDGYITQAEFDARPQGGRGGAGRGGPGGPGGPGGAPGRGGPPAQ